MKKLIGLIFAFALLSHSALRAEEGNDKEKKVAISLGVKTELGGGTNPPDKFDGPVNYSRIEIGPQIKAQGLEAKISFFASQDQNIHPAYWSAGHQMLVGNKAYFVGPFKLKGDIGYIGQIDKDDKNKVRLLAGIQIKGLASLCTSSQEEEKIRLCLDTLFSGMSMIENGGRIDLGVGLSAEAKVAKNVKVNAGVRYNYMLSGSGLYSSKDDFVSGNYIIGSLGVDFDLNNKAISSKKDNKK